MRYFFFTALCVFSFLPKINAAADSAIYSISIAVKGLKSSKAVLGYHYGDQRFVVDSTTVDTSTGFFSFKTRQKRAEGMYFVALTEGAAKGILFDIILTTDHNFSIETHVNAPIDSANVSKSLENIQFFSYQKRVKLMQTELADMRSTLQLLQRATKDRAVLAEQEQKMTEKAKELDVFMGDQIQKYPNSYTTKLLKLLRNPTVPSYLQPYSNDKKPNPNYVFWYRQHYFDGMDFSDERLLRSPYYVARLNQFLGKIVVPLPDSMKTYLDMLLEKAHSKNGAVYQYTLRWLTNLFDSNIEKPYADTYLVHLVEKYQHTPDAGTDKTTLERLDYKVAAFKPNLIGNAAPPFSLPDTEGALKSISDVKSDYTLLVFYSALCSHCRETMPKIQQALQMTDSTRISVFTVCTDGLTDAWKAFLTEMKMGNWTNVLDAKTDSDIQKKYATWNLPTLYLLNKNKEIVAKRLKSEDLSEIVKAIFSEKK